MSLLGEGTTRGGSVQKKEWEQRVGRNLLTMPFIRNLLYPMAENR
jgi:hypothetical protein